MTQDDHKDTLLRYLLVGRDALRWKIDGLSEYDTRRPLTATGTNLLGLMKHVAGVTADYFGATFDRPFPDPLPFDDDDPLADMWVGEHESQHDVLALWDAAWEHAEATIRALPLDAPGLVPWWQGDRARVTLQQILVHMIAEAHRHAGHADIVRETIDGAAGLKVDSTNMPDTDWPAYVARIEQAARATQS